MVSIESVKGDITEQDVDAVVNAANKELRPGGGVDGAIHRAGGPSIAREAREIAERDGHLSTGEAVATSAGELSADHVIHTVGPVWNEHSEEEAVRLLGNCYSNSLELARELGCDSVAFPNISTGVYGFPKRLAGETAVNAVREWTSDHPDELKRVIFVAFDEDNFQIYEGLLDD